MLYSTNELGGRRVLASNAQVPARLASGIEATGGSPAHAVEPRRKALGQPSTARQRTGSLPRAPPEPCCRRLDLAARKMLGRCGSAQRSATKASQQMIVMSNDVNPPWRNVPACRSFVHRESAPRSGH